MERKNSKNFIGVSSVILVFMASLMLNYNTFQKAPYLLVYIPLAMLFVKLIQNKGFNGLKRDKIDKYFSIILLISFAYICISGVAQHKSKYFFLDYSFVYLLILYLHVSFMNYGIRFAEKLFKHLTFWLNMFSVINLYQVIFRKPFLMSYMHVVQGGYQINIGTEEFRTMSVFGYPVVAGLFFVITFLCNIYVLKTSFKVILQFLLLVNIYSTLSRSAWLSLLIVLIVYFLINSKYIFGKIPKFKLTYKRIFYMYLSLIFILGALVFVGLNFDYLYNSIVMRFGNSLSNNSTDVSNLQRTETVSTILDYMFNSNIINLFFGYGFETAVSFMLHHTVIIPYFTTTDNQYLTWFYEFGIIGILGYLITLVYLIVKVFKKKVSWVQELSILCFVVMSFEFIFFEGFAWKTVAIMVSILSAILSFNFNVETKKTSQIQ